MTESAINLDNDGVNTVNKAVKVNDTSEQGTLVTRYDSVDVSRSARLNLTREGYLEGHIVSGRVGVLKYATPDGNIRREFRPPEEVFNEACLNSFKMQPITNNHPYEYGGMVDAKNAKQVTVGFTGNDVKHDETFVSVDAKITDQGVINQIRNGKRELSEAYTCRTVKRQGVWNGESYDYVQTEIRGNHIAIVDKGRAGEQVRIRLNGLTNVNDAICVSDDITKQEESMKMKTIRLNDKEYEVEEAIAKRLNAIEDENAALKKSKDELNDKLEALRGEKDALKSKLDDLSARTNADEINKLVEERLDLMQKASEFLGNEVKLNGLSDKDIKIKAIQSISPEFKANDFSDNYINARFDALYDIKNQSNLAANFDVIRNNTADYNAQGFVDVSNAALEAELINKTYNK